MFNSDVCKILKCDGTINQLIGAKLMAATSYGIAYGGLCDALGNQINYAAQFGESTKVWDTLQTAAAVAYGNYLQAAFTTLATTNPDAGWINNLAKDGNQFTDDYLIAVL